MKWISIKERLPIPMKDVLFISVNRNMFVGFLDPDKELIHPAQKGEINEVLGITHWMPLPEPPKVKERFKVGDKVYAETVINGQKLCGYGEIVHIDKETACVKSFISRRGNGGGVLWVFNLSELSKEVRE